MPRFVHPETKHTVETAIPREAAELRRDGYREQKPRPQLVRHQEGREADRQAEKTADKTAGKTTK